MAESYLGVPVVSGQRAVGIVALARMPQNAFSEADERLLSTIASSLGVALENARLFDETKRLLSETEQRNAELAVINEIGEALAKQLDFDAIVDLVGDRMAAMFKTTDIYIALHDKAAGLIRFPYELDHGQRVHGEPIPFGQGLTSRVIVDRRPYRFGTIAAQHELGGFLGTYAPGEAATYSESWLGVPIMAGTEAIGVVVLGDAERDKFTEADQGLISTIASSMGVALENARLFDETKHLLAETGARAGELAIINEIGSALAKQLDFQGIIDAVGDRVGAILGTNTVTIGLYDPGKQTITFPYSVEDGERFPDETIPLGPGLTSRIIETRRPLRLGSMADATALGARVVGDPDSPDKESFLGVPILAGERVLGVISVALEPRNAFSESDERLLVTLASSMGVALENARLFDETKQREWPSSQSSMRSAPHWPSSSTSRPSSMPLVTGSARSSSSRDLSIAILDPATNMISFPYYIENGVTRPQLALIGFG